MKIKILCRVSTANLVAMYGTWESGERQPTATRPLRFLAAAVPPSCLRTTHSSASDQTHQAVPPEFVGFVEAVKEVRTPSLRGREAAEGGRWESIAAAGGNRGGADAPWERQGVIEEAGGGRSGAGEGDEVCRFGDSGRIARWGRRWSPTGNRGGNPRSKHLVEIDGKGLSVASGGIDGKGLSVASGKKFPTAVGSPPFTHIYATSFNECEEGTSPLLPRFLLRKQGKASMQHRKRHKPKGKFPVLGYVSDKSYTNANASIQDCSRAYK